MPARPAPPALPLTAFTTRAGLLWPPRARDLDRILAAARAPGAADPPRVLDHGAGSALLARLLAPRADVVAYDPGAGTTIGSFHPVAREPPRGPFDLVVSSWMEAGFDLRADVARFAPRVLSVFDVEGGCGVKGDLSYAPFGLKEACRWSGPSFEDVEEALRRRGRGLAPRARNAFVLWTAPAETAEAAARVRGAPATFEPLPWEPELAALGVAPDSVVDG